MTGVQTCALPISFQSDLYPAEASSGSPAEPAAGQSPGVEGASETSEQNVSASGGEVSETSDQPVEAPAGRTEE